MLDRRLRALASARARRLSVTPEQCRPHAIKDYRPTSALLLPTVASIFSRSVSVGRQISIMPINEHPAGPSASGYGPRWDMGAPRQAHIFNDSCITLRMVACADLFAESRVSVPRTHRVPHWPDSLRPRGGKLHASESFISSKLWALIHIVRRYVRQAGKRQSGCIAAANAELSPKRQWKRNYLLRPSGRKT